jgi:hypothetical protein
MKKMFPLISTIKKLSILEPIWKKFKFRLYCKEQISGRKKGGDENRNKI